MPAPPGMKVLLIDIETSPNLVWAFGLRQQNIGLNQIVEQTRMLCFAAQWLGERKVHFYSEHHHDRLEMIQAAHDLLSEADVVMHYNGTSFDVPHLHREFLEQGMPPPEPFAQIDLLRTVRRQFRFSSNKLDNITRQLGLAGKVSHEGFGLWSACMAGDDAAWRRMKKYNRQDVVLLGELYELLQPWITTHPNANLYDIASHDGQRCPKCGSDDLQRRGQQRTQVTIYQRFRCNSCGGYSRSSKSSGSSSRRPA